jgi:uncharacterized protein (TIGR02246 family)
MVMSSQNDEKAVRGLYEAVIGAWNKRDAGRYAGLFADDANVVGFDGSIMNGKAAILTELSRIFAEHMTAPYIYKVRELRFLTPDSALLRAVVGMLSPTKTDINPAANAIQSLVAVREDYERWSIALFQNTPAQFHGRPELAEALSDELRQVIR